MSCNFCNCYSTNLFKPNNSNYNLNILNLNYFNVDEKISICSSILKDMNYLHKNMKLFYGFHSICINHISVRFNNDKIQYNLSNLSYINASEKQDNSQLYRNDVNVFIIFIFKIICCIYNNDINMCDLYEVENNAAHLLKLSCIKHPEKKLFFEKIYKCVNTTSLEDLVNIIDINKSEDKQFNICEDIELKDKEFDNQFVFLTNDLVTAIDICNTYNVSTLICEIILKLFLSIREVCIFENSKEALFVSIFSVFRLYKINYEMNWSSKHTELINRFMKTNLFCLAIPLIKDKVIYSAMEILFILKQADRFILNYEDKDKRRDLLKASSNNSIQLDKIKTYIKGELNKMCLVDELQLYILKDL